MFGSVFSQYCTVYAIEIGTGDIKISVVLDFFQSFWPSFKDGVKTGWEIGQFPIDWIKDKLSNFMKDENTIDGTNPNSPIRYDESGTNIYIDGDFINELNQQVKDSIHRLDGYYLLEQSSDNLRGVLSDLFDKGYNSSWTYSGLKKDVCVDAWMPLFNSSSSFIIYLRYTQYDGRFLLTTVELKDSICYLSWQNQIYPNAVLHYLEASSSPFYYANTSYIPTFAPNAAFTFFGAPIMIFYNKTAYDKYMNEGKSFVPNIKLDASGIKFPKEILSDNKFKDLFNFDLGDTSGLSEDEIQQKIDNAVNEIISNMNQGGSDFPTPTPEPIETPIPDDSPDFTVTNAWLKKIYEYFQTFGKSHDTFAKKITDYIQKNDGKLDQIITALEKIASGEPSGEENGCKYDYTVLSDFLTQLWNESDKKFDNMVKLLEENNEYQQKIVTSLNEIKALLIVDTVLDFFQNRSQETANKAKEKFPTSIPWDIAMVVNAMCAEPESPVIRCPIKIESLGINEELVVDLSQDEWAKLAKTCRSMLSILFVLYMIHLTRELFFKGGDA